MIENFCLSRKPNLTWDLAIKMSYGLTVVYFFTLILSCHVSSVVDPMVYRHCSGYHTRLVMGRHRFESYSGHVIFFFISETCVESH